MMNWWAMERLMFLTEPIYLLLLHCAGKDEVLKFHTVPTCFSFDWIFSNPFNTDIYLRWFWLADWYRLARTRSKQVVLYHCQDHRVMPVGQLHCWNSHCHSMTPRKLLHEVAIHLMLSSMATQLRSWCVTGCWTSGKFERERTLDSGPGLRRGDA